MFDSLEVAQPRLYLDVDGVIISDTPAFETTILDSLGEAYAPEVISRLGSTCLELVWLSTWENEALGLAERINGLRDGRVLKLVEHETNNSITRKMGALFSDQANSPSPFVWVDDRITLAARRAVARYLNVPKLIIKTDANTGLNESQLRSIEDFARNHSK